MPLDKTKTLRSQLFTRKPTTTKGGVIFSVEVGGMPVSLTLVREVLDLEDAEFSIRYGRIVRQNMNVEEVCSELGAAILMGLVDAGKLPKGGN